MACNTWPAGPCGHATSAILALRAIDPVTAERMGIPLSDDVGTGVLSTASGLVFAGDGDGNLMAFESRTGKNLWHYQLGSALRSTSGTTYMLDGRQYLPVPSGSMLTAFALPPVGLGPASHDARAARLRRTSIASLGRRNQAASRLV